MIRVLQNKNEFVNLFIFKWKSVEKVNFGDTLMGPNWKAQTIKKIYHIPMKKWYICWFNWQKPFFTTTHPFMTLDGLKSLNPEWTMQESPWLKITLMKVWDTLVKKDWFEKILSINCELTWWITVYDFGIDDTKLFYANWYLTHNVNWKVIWKLFMTPSVYAIENKK